MDSPRPLHGREQPTLRVDKIWLDLSLRTRISGLTLFQQVGGIEIVDVISDNLDRH